MSSKNCIVSVMGSVCKWTYLTKFAIELFISGKSSLTHSPVIPQLPDRLVDFSHAYAQIEKPKHFQDN